MAVGRSLSEVGYSLTWTDIRAFMSSLGSESNFWQRVAPEAAEKVSRKKEILRIDNQLLMALHDALWDIAYAQAGSDQKLPRMLSTLLNTERPEDEATRVNEAESRSIAESMRLERGD